MLLLVVITFLDYLYGFSVLPNKNNKAKVFLWLSLINNLGILVIFKYYNFFVSEFQNGAKSFGINSNPLILNLVLPIGISFYTFHGMSYIIDIYRGKQKPISNFIDYSLFVSFFPLLVAGPIERANHLLPQIQEKRRFDYTKLVEGCKLLVWGFTKKIVIADSLAYNVDYIFSNYSNLNSISLILGAISFSFQIYCDFSGYSDIALGTAKLFGFELLSNFKFPYFARDIAEFWRRWHISLSSWFKDYLYIPLGGSKQGMFLALRNTLIIFLVSGFWHGPSWKFIFWGFLHAIYFLPLLLKNKNRINLSEVVADKTNIPSIEELAKMTTTFVMVTIAWIFFRSENLNEAFQYFIRILSELFISTNYNSQKIIGLNSLFYICPFIIIEWFLRRDERNLNFNVLKQLPPFIRFVIYNIISIVLLLTLLRQSNRQFIYFNF